MINMTNNQIERLACGVWISAYVHLIV